MFSTKLIASQLKTAFMRDLPIAYHNQDDTLYAGMITMAGEIVFDIQCTDFSKEFAQKVAADRNSSIVGYFSAIQLKSMTTQEMAEILDMFEEDKKSDDEFWK